jgi:predicted nucleic acid-binding protein
MDILSNDKESAAKAQVYLNRMKSGTEGIVSSVVFAELVFHIKRKRGKEKAEEILMYIASLPNITIVPVTAEIAKLAGNIRARYIKKISKKLTYFDCIHIATALDAGCDAFVTGDKGFKEIKEIKMDIY